jgi:hypothetical protein
VTLLLLCYCFSYDPELGRFIQPDTIVPSAENPQDLNRYTYARNNPLAYVDPSGHWPKVNFKLDQLMENVGAALKNMTESVSKFFKSETSQTVTYVIVSRGGKILQVVTLKISGGDPASLPSDVTLPSGNTAQKIDSSMAGFYGSFAKSNGNAGPASAMDRFLTPYVGALNAYRGWQDQVSLWEHVNLPSFAKWEDENLPWIAEGISMATMTAGGGGGAGILRGRLGGLAHRQVVSQIEANIASRSLFSEREVIFRALNVEKGVKGAKYADVVARSSPGGPIVEIYQVGRMTKGGIPVAREIGNASTIAERAGQDVIFVPYNAP